MKVLSPQSGCIFTALQTYMDPGMENQKIGSPAGSAPGLNIQTWTQIFLPPLSHL